MRFLLGTLILTLSLFFTACGEDEIMAQNNSQQEEAETYQSYTMNISINGKTLTATMATNSSATALKALLEKGNLTFSVNDYGGFEKVGNIGHDLPQNNEQIATVPGDIILYQGNAICLYYGQNSWNFTRLGKINYSSETELRDFLNAGGGSISVTLSLAKTSDIKNTAISTSKACAIYNLEGKPVDAKNARNGIYIINGKKVKIKTERSF